MFSESEGRLEEERRREVGCQWESPEEERREVGCQSDSAERRDAAVQVDLLRQQLSWRHTGVCGVAWQCVSVRADEPGGGALLQHCRTHHCSPLGHTQLPTMPLFQSPAPPEFKELQQTTSLPSMPLCEALPLLPPADVSAPPPGLIAPLSPHLAEEEEEKVGEEKVGEEVEVGEQEEEVKVEVVEVREEEVVEEGKVGEEKVVEVEVEVGEEEEEEEVVDGVKPEKTEDTEKVRRPRRKRVGPPIRYLLESEGQSHGLSVANHSRGVTVKEEVEEEGIKPVKTDETEQAGRPRRKTVGPPIRYLLESEEPSHGLAGTNHSTARGAKVKVKPGRLRTGQQEEEERTGGVELTQRTASGRVESSEDGGWLLCQVCGLTFTCQSSLQLHLSVHRAGSRLSCTNTSLLHHHHHKQEEVNTTSDGERMERGDEVEVKTLLPAATKASDWLRCRKRVCRNPRWWVDFCTTMRRRRQERDGARGRKRRRCREEEEERGGGGGEEEKEEEQQPQRPRRTMVGPPIRYLLESEELSHGPITTNQDRAGGLREGRKPQKKINAEGGASEDAAMIDSHTERSGRTNQDRVNRLKGRGGRPNKVRVDSEAGGGASERHKTLLPASTKVTDWLRRSELVRRNLRWWIDYRTTMRRRQQERDGARRRKRRRCREEEEERKEEVKRVRLKEEGGEEEEEEEREEEVKQICLKEEGGEEEEEEEREEEVVKQICLKEEGGGEEEEVEEREEEVKTLLPAATKASDWLRCRKRVCRNPRWWVDFCITMRRRRQERDGARGRKKRRCREDEEERGRRGGGEEEEEKEEEEEQQQPQRPRRTMVGPPIRYLLESEELSHGPITTNQDRAGGLREGRKPQKKINAEGGASEDAAMIDSHTERSGQTNQDRVNRLKGRGGRPNKVRIDSEAGGGASERHKTLLPASTKTTDWLRRSELVRRNLRWWIDYRTTMRRRQQERDGARRRKRRRCREEEEERKEEVKRVRLKEEGGEEEEESKEEEEERRTEVKKEEESSQRPRRTTVGPPIRYLLESEELSHGPATAYQDRAWGFKEGRKPQKKSQAGGGASDDAAMIDRPEETDRQAERQMGPTNQDRLDGPNESGGRPNKVVIHREARGGASEMTDRATPVSDRQTGSYTRSYLVYVDLQSSEVTVLSPCCVRLQRLPLIG